MAPGRRCADPLRVTMWVIHTACLACAGYAAQVGRNIVERVEVLLSDAADARPASTGTKGADMIKKAGKVWEQFLSGV